MSRSGWAFMKVAGVDRSWASATMVFCTDLSL